MRQGPSARKQTDGAELDVSVVASKASISLENRESEIIRKWLKAVIDDMELASLQALPTGELSSTFPQLIAYISKSIQVPAEAEELFSGEELGNLAACMATMRQGEPAAAKVFDDYSMLKHLFLEAAAEDLRTSDIQALQVFQRIDNSFMQFFRTGLEAFIERYSMELQRLANTDALTGLFNVRYFRKQLSEKLELYRRYQLPFALLMLDLDMFKQLNDREGHEAGDKALIKLSQIMSEEKREIDVAVRSGGDEFFVLLPNTNLEQAESLALRINERVRRLRSETGGSQITSVSIGIVSCPLHGADVGTLRARADQALYLAKKGGGGTTVCYQESAGPGNG